MPQLKTNVRGFAKPSARCAQTVMLCAPTGALNTKETLALANPSRVAVSRAPRHL